MVTKEIKQFVITQMKESEWEVEKLNVINYYKSKHINIEHDTTISQKVTLLIKEKEKLRLLGIGRNS